MELHINQIEPLYNENWEIKPEFSWVSEGKGMATVWWETATLSFSEGYPVVDGDVTDEVKSIILAKAKDKGITEGFYFVCGPDICGNIYRFDEITFIGAGEVKMPFYGPRKLETIRNYLLLQGYRGIVFVNQDLVENNAAYINTKQIAKR